MLITFEWRVPNRSDASQNDHKRIKAPWASAFITDFPALVTIVTNGDKMTKADWQ